jgi:hypothetical protein
MYVSNNKKKMFFLILFFLINSYLACTIEEDKCFTFCLPTPSPLTITLTKKITDEITLTQTSKETLKEVSTLTLTETMMNTSFSSETPFQTLSVDDDSDPPPFVFFPQLPSSTSSEMMTEEVELDDKTPETCTQACSSSPDACDPTPTPEN